MAVYCAIVVCHNDIQTSAVSMHMANVLGHLSTGYICMECCSCTGQITAASQVACNDCMLITAGTEENQACLRVAGQFSYGRSQLKPSCEDRAAARPHCRRLYEEGPFRYSSSLPIGKTENILFYLNSVHADIRADGTLGQGGVECPLIRSAARLTKESGSWGGL